VAKRARECATQLLYIAAELKICHCGPIVTSAYQDFRNIDWFGRKDGESVIVKTEKIGAAGYGGDKSPRLFS